VPDGVINIVTTQKNVIEVGKEMCESKIVKKVSFTGSTPVAKLLYGMSASTLKKLTIRYFVDTNADNFINVGCPSKPEEMHHSLFLVMPTSNKVSKVHFTP